MSKPNIESIQHAIQQAETHLCRYDKTMAKLIKRYGPCTMYDKTTLFHKPAYHALVWAIINQQLSVASARSIENRLAKLHRGNVFKQNTISKLSETKLRACGLSHQKIRYLRALSDAVNHGQLKLRQLHRLPDEKIVDCLTSITGIGPWTADMFLMFAMARLDILPLGDLALRKAIENIYHIDLNENNNKFETINAAWKPYRTIASWYLWCAVD